MLNILEGRTIDEIFPIVQLVTILTFLNHFREFLVVFLGGISDFSDQLLLPLDSRPLVSKLVHNRNQEDDFVPLVEQKESIFLDLVENFLIFAHIVELSIIVYILSLDCHFFIGFHLFPHSALEVFLFVIVDDADCIVHYIFFFLEFTGMDDDEVLVQVQLAHIVCDFSFHRQGQM